MVTLATRNAARFAVVTITATSRSAHVRAKAQEALGGTEEMGVWIGIGGCWGWA
jgi:hypothetical protein